MDPEEDKVNKKDRPLPSGRIALKRAVQLRWLLVPVCFLFSIVYSVQTLYSSIALAVLTYIHNDAQLSWHWFLKNFMTAAVLVSFEIGAILVAGSSLYPNLPTPF